MKSNYDYIKQMGRQIRALRATGDPATRFAASRLEHLRLLLKDAIIDMEVRLGE